VAGDEPFTPVGRPQFERLGDLVAENVDREALLHLMENGASSGLPFVPPGTVRLQQRTGALVGQGSGG
jgi:adenosylcobyric acid synthase